MNNKQKALALWAIACDLERPLAERLAAQADLRQLKRTSKTSFGKLGVEQRIMGGTLIIPGVDMTPEVTLEVAADPLEQQPDPLEEVPETVEEASTALKARSASMGATTSKAKARKAGDERGLISAEVRRQLLETDAPYAEIEASVRAKFPKAVTTTRSIASVASDLRGRGEKVATRRVAAKAK